MLRLKEALRLHQGIVAAFVGAGSLPHARPDSRCD